MPNLCYTLYLRCIRTLFLTKLGRFLRAPKTFFSRSVLAVFVAPKIKDAEKSVFSATELFWRAQESLTPPQPSLNNIDIRNQAQSKIWMTNSAGKFDLNGSFLIVLGALLESYFFRVAHSSMGGVQCISSRNVRTPRAPRSLWIHHQYQVCGGRVGRDILSNRLKIVRFSVEAVKVRTERSKHF